MSRLSTLSQTAIREFYSPNSIENLITLVTIYDPLDTSKVVARICDGWTDRLTISSLNIGDPDGTNTSIAAKSTATEDLIVDLETDTTINAEDIIYGVPSGGSAAKPFIFLPLDITLPDEAEGRAPRASITIFNATRYFTPLIRRVDGPPKIKFELVLSSNPTNVEIVFDSFYISNINYNRDQVTLELSMIDYDREPFPQHTFSPSYFPGIF